MLPAGHPGPYKTRELITRNYFWPRMQRMIDAYTQGCEVCQQDKIDRQPLRAPLHPHEVPMGPWQVVTCDMIGPLPESNGFNAIEVFVNKFTGRTHMEPTFNTLTAEGFANLLRDHVMEFQKC